MSIKNQIQTDRLPRHIAIIMDGNGRWAKKQGKLRMFGHQHGVAAVRDTVEGAAELGIEYLTLYAFSTENWNRPAIEINALMELLVNTISKETKTLMDNNIRLNAIGDIESLPGRCNKNLKTAIDKTAGNSRMTLTLALSYSSRWEITRAIKRIAQDVKDGKLNATEINDSLVEKYLTTAGIPDPELLIRTSGEYRVSNFLLWQIAYSEFYFTNKLWPDFRREDLFESIVSYQNRDRRFGGVNESTNAKHA
ncbi:MAG TPA: isoprenyl transferase [Bacteroidia bacterium]|nr:isoprenyl transferase [Bacteroidia bacterium]QQR95731.1 MAG: isoprenyl transferase [Bacteroidota bacterium]MBP7715457.1 isoprenyl transferase [Bacteroidia bacterium]MBP8667540.1 isoprenyl transferase [Bacteroidia bacterium]HOZ83590.1 isoprenyl transferase [Bacteroidia bacterium]